MSLQLLDPAQKVQELVEFLHQTYHQQGKTHAVIAVSGGIDSALALSLLVQSLPKSSVTALLLPYGEQSTEDGKLICDFHKLSEQQVRIINIGPIVDATAAQLELDDSQKVRKGNLMARARMMVVYDVAKSLDALVCGTENKSEHYLGYFTRFGDAASDVEPISTLYKTQVRQLAEYLKLPERFLTKAPSAGLWSGQTDEAEMGFSYADADQVLEQLLDEGKDVEKIMISGVSPTTVKAIADQVLSTNFKRTVPHSL